MDPTYPHPKPPDPDQVPKVLQQELLEATKICSLRNQVKNEEAEAVREMKCRHRKERKEMKKRHAREKKAKMRALERAIKPFESSQQKVGGQIVQIAKHDLQTITLQIQEKLPPEIRCRIYELCWDDKAISWAQDMLRYTQIQSLDRNRPDSDSDSEDYETAGKREDYAEACRWNCLSRVEKMHYKKLTEQGARHLRELNEADKQHLEYLRHMDRAGIPGSSKQDREEENSAWNCIGPWITSKFIVDRSAVPEIIQSFYKANPSTFYVEIPHIKPFLNYDPFTAEWGQSVRGFRPAQFLSAITIPLHRPKYNIASLNITSSGDFEPLLDIARKECFTLRFLLFRHECLYKPGFADLRKVKVILNTFKEIFNKVECVYMCGCQHTRASGCVYCDGEFHDYNAKPVVVDEVFEAPVEEWGRKLRETTFCDDCTPLLDRDIAEYGWTL